MAVHRQPTHRGATVAIATVFCLVIQLGHVLPAATSQPQSPSPMPSPSAKANYTIEDYLKTVQWCHLHDTVTVSGTAKDDPDTAEHVVQEASGVLSRCG